MRRIKEKDRSEHYNYQHELENYRKITSKRPLLLIQHANWLKAEILKSPLLNSLLIDETRNEAVRN